MKPLKIYFTLTIAILISETAFSQHVHSGGGDNARGHHQEGLMPTEHGLERQHCDTFNNKK